MRGHRDLKVYQFSYQLGMEIFEISKRLPVDERYSLTDQIRRSSRSVAANIAEAFRKRQYPKAFLNKLSDADGEATETQVWIDFSFDSRYIPAEDHERLMNGYIEIGKMLGSMMSKPETFLPR